MKSINKSTNESEVLNESINESEDEATTIATQNGEGNVHNNQNGEDPNYVLETSPVLRRSSRQRNLPSKLNDFVVGSSVRYDLKKYVRYSKLFGTNFCFSTTLNKSVEPKFYPEASQNPKWVKDMNLEMEALHMNNTYVLADLLPGRKAIGCKWIWKIKYKSSGEVDRDLNKEVYMELNPVYYDKNETKVYRLVKSLYGLKQASRKWNEKLTTTLIENGFVHSKNDYSLYVKNKKNCLFIAILVYVDETVNIGNNEFEIDKFKKFLSSKFMIKDLGLLKYFIGIEVLENESGLCLSQRKYCLELLCEYGLLACKPAATPLQQNVVLSHVDSDNDNQHMHALLQSHSTVALRVLRYLKNAPEKVSSGVIKTLKVASANNVADIFTGPSLRVCGVFYSSKDEV
ncbi:ribonuclease H-like domain-containing protein [Tanacetum coccineum]